MPTGFDSRAYARLLLDARPEDRPLIKARFGAWIMAGAKAQGMYNWGGALLPVGVFAAIMLYVQGLNAWPFYVLCVFAAVAGAACMRIAMRRERTWRRANPFDSWNV